MAGRWAAVWAWFTADGPTGGFPHALVTMWAWITEDRAEADRVFTDRLAPLLKGDPVSSARLPEQGCAGSPVTSAMN